MRSSALGLGLALFLSVGSLGVAFAQPPDQFALYQNDPNPFCGWTRINFALPQQVQIDLSVWNPDSTMVVRTLIAGVHPAGYFTVLWDGRDQDGALLPDGSYPYVLTAVAEPGAPPLFTGSLRAMIECVTPSESHSWGALKARYRETAHPLDPPR